MGIKLMQEKSKELQRRAEIASQQKYAMLKVSKRKFSIVERIVSFGTTLVFPTMLDNRGNAVYLAIIAGRRS